MALAANSPKYSLDTVMPKLGSVLKTLFEEGQRKKPGTIPYRKLVQEIPGDTDAQEAYW